MGIVRSASVAGNEVCFDLVNGLIFRLPEHSRKLDSAQPIIKAGMMCVNLLAETGSKLFAQFPTDH